MELVRNGSRGDSVYTLQKKLNEHGYGLAEDGIFGNNTYNAVIDYQRNNGLAVDGIVGDNTWGSLLGSSSSTPSAYDEARSARINYESNNKPTYSSLYDDKIDALTQKYSGRKPFSYDLTNDSLYKQYKDQYVKTGKQAAEDTVAQAAALSGGYGNSYGATASNQAYQSYLGKLNNIIPTLEQNAHAKYTQEGNDLLNELALYQNMENTKYNRYQDQLSDYWNTLNYLQTIENNEYNKEQQRKAEAEAKKKKISSSSSSSSKTKSKTSSNNITTTGIDWLERWVGLVSGEYGLISTAQARENMNSLGSKSEKWQYVKAAYDAGNISTSTYQKLRSEI